MALLEKWCWRLYVDKEGLRHKVLAAKYRGKLKVGVQGCRAGETIYVVLERVYMYMRVVSMRMRCASFGEQ